MHPLHHVVSIARAHTSGLGPRAATGDLGPRAAAGDHGRECSTGSADDPCRRQKYGKLPTEVLAGLEPALAEVKCIA